MKFPLVFTVAFAAVIEVLVTPNGFESSNIDLRVGDSLILRGSRDLVEKHNVRQVKSTASCGSKQGDTEFDSTYFSAGRTMVTSFDNSGVFVIASGKDSSFCSYMTVKVADLPNPMAALDFQNIKAMMADQGSAIKYYKAGILMILPLLLI